MSLTALGFQKKTLAQCKSEREITYKDIFGQALNTQPGTVASKLIGIESEREAAVWDLAEAIYFSQFPNTATGAALANLGAITNSVPRRATSSFVLNQLLFGTPGETIPANTVFSVEGNPTARFRTVNQATLDVGIDAVQKVEFSDVPDNGDWTLTLEDNGPQFEIAFDATDEEIQDLIQADARYDGVLVTGDTTIGFTFTFAGDQGKRPWALVTTQSDLFNGVAPVTISVTSTTTGVPQAVTQVVAETTGPVYAPTGTLTVIETPVTGLDRTLNLADATLGRNAETDAEFRLRRINELAQSGNASVPAIKAKIETVPGVIKAIVFENDTLSVDGEGRPPKSVQVFVAGGDDQAIGDMLWNSKTGGIQTFGAVEVTVTDVEQGEQKVYFNRPDVVPLYVEVDVQKNPLLYPVDGDTQIENAILAYGDSLTIGEDVYVYPKLLPAIVNNVPGITNITIKIGKTVSPTLDANIVIDPNEIAEFDSARIVVGTL